jgi:HAD superfamily hydrolase (TIGR01509 family)
MVKRTLKEDGVEVYEGSIALARRWRDEGFKMAVVSASKNCEAVLKAAGIEGLFELRVDGVVAAERKLAGKPRPDTFLEAAKELGVSPDRAVVVEDAISGVQAGRAGKFGLVIGVNRQDKADALRENGADLVVSDLAEIP